MFAGDHRVIGPSSLLAFLDLLKRYCPLPSRNAVACQIVKHTASRRAAGDDGECKGVGVGRHSAERPFVMHFVRRHRISVIPKEVPGASV